MGFSSSAAARQNDKEAAGAAGGASGDAGAGNEGAESAGEQQQTSKYSVEELQAALTGCQESLEGEKKKADDFKDKLMRTLADMENLRERTARQTQEVKQFAVQSLLKSLLDVADNMERAAGSVSPEDIDSNSEIDLERALSLLKSLRDGVVLTDNILMKILEKEGVKKYDPMGEPFDPNLHMALFQVPDATKEPGTVAVVVKKGYMLHDRAVRAAEVGVATAVSQPEA